MSNSSPKQSRIAAPSQSIPISGIRRTQSELELAQAELLADYRDGRMFERILTGILWRCDRTGTCHPKTITSLENIIRTKMLDYGSISELHRRCHANEDWIIGDKSESIIPLLARELTRHKVSSTSLCSSSGLENDSLDSSMSSLSCFSTTQIGSDSESEAAHDVESGIFELEL